MHKKKTILIFGITSFVGSNLAQILRKKYRVIGTYYKTPVSIKGILTIKCDVHNKDLVQKVTYLFQPDVTIYAAGLTKMNDCQDFPKVADALNTAGVFNVSAASERYHSKFIYFSSCYVFSGEDITYRESDSPLPTSVYGNTVASSEFFIQKSCLNYIIFRCAPIFGRSYNPMALTFVEAIERNEFNGAKVVCDTKVNTGYLDIYTVAEIVDIAIQKNITNRLFQLTSSDMMNRYEFAKAYLESFGGNTSILAKGDGKFPRTENQLALEKLGEEGYFKMDTFNMEDVFEIKAITIKEMIEKYKSKVEGVSTGSKRSQDTGITFI